MSQRDGLRKAVAIAAIAALVIVAALVTFLGITLYGYYHHASRALQAVLPRPPAPAQAGLLPHVPPAAVIGVAVLVAAGVFFRLRKRR
jgi:hypothetical protein